MITAVDSNILIDVLGGDPHFGSYSASLLRECLQQGAVHACEVVWTEVATMFVQDKQFLSNIEKLGIEFSMMNEESALRAAKAWRVYRASGGKGDRIAADFLIGAHAITQCDQLLTRDKGFYREYFKQLKIMNPVSLM